MRIVFVGFCAIWIEIFTFPYTHLTMQHDDYYSGWEFDYYVQTVGIRNTRVSIQWWDAKVILIIFNEITQHPFAPHKMTGLFFLHTLTTWMECVWHWRFGSWDTYRIVPLVMTEPMFETFFAYTIRRCAYPFESFWKSNKNQMPLAPSHHNINFVMWL